VKEKEAVASVLRRVGGTAYLLREGEQIPFRADIQARYLEERRQGSALGVGERLVYRLYADASEAALSLREGDRILWQNQLYHVRRIETYWLQEKAVCRQGELRLASPEENI
jgi:hypothetical protein